jgi:hypothetical protein
VGEGPHERMRSREANIALGEGKSMMLQSLPPVIYVQQRHSSLHGPLTILLVLWAIALPALMVLLIGLGPIGWLVGFGAGILLAVPWFAGIVILWFLRHIS